MRMRMKSEMIGSCAFALLLGGAVLPVRGAGSPVATVDFGTVVGRVRPELHASGWTPRLNGLASKKVNPDVETIKRMGLSATRTHDWPLVMAGQRVVDTHFLFPLAHLDARDPSNYYFEQTDYVLEGARACGLEVFYRLGTSIEHSGTRHFNARIPDDFDKLAEVFAGTVRHYNRGWGKDGRRWGIRYWEIWNEPDGVNTMWCKPGGDTPENAAERMESFAKFYVTCLKRLKDEFGDEIKVGGPSLRWYQPDNFQLLFDACKAKGVKPDFISWHYYGNDPKEIVKTAELARKLCDDNGLPKCELIVNEWHYRDCTWEDLRSPNPAVVAKCLEGPTGHNGTDSAAFTLANLALFQTSKLDQAYFYGCSHSGAWGYMDEKRQLNKNYYACCLFGEIVRNYDRICSSAALADNYYALAVSGDGNRKALLVVDYRNVSQVIEVSVRGIGQDARVRAQVLDHTRDNLPCDADFHDGVLTLVKPDKYSAAYLVAFE